MTENKANRKKPIEGYVAGILTERELVINVGSDQGVRPGMKFKVVANALTDITDPNTGEVLGSIIREKVRVEATDVQPRLSVCKTYRVHRTPGGVFGGNVLGDLFEPPRETPETLRAEDASYLPDLPEQDSYVKKGDRVEQYFGGD